MTSLREARHLHRFARRAVMLATALVAVLSLPSAHADNFADGSSFCDGTAQFGTGEGTLSQVNVHSDIFRPAFASVCPSEGSTISYLGTGDNQGINALAARTRPFVGSDVPMTTAQKIQTENVISRQSLIHQVPLYVDGWAIAYNVPCTGPPINFTSTMLSGIYLGQITKWNDPQIVAGDVISNRNDWLAGCNESIRLTKRADVAGATTVFLDYLSKRNAVWLPFRRGVAPQQWPPVAFACSGQGDDGMVNCINSFRGAIGYVRIAVAAANNMSVGKVQNATGSMVTPSGSGCGAAATAAVTPPDVQRQPIPVVFQGQQSTSPPVNGTLGDWSAVSMTDAPDVIGGPKSYPICSFSYIFIPQSWFSAYGGTISGFVARAAIDYFTVALRDSTQARLPTLGVAPLPPKILQISLSGIQSISLLNFIPTQ